MESSPNVVRGDILADEGAAGWSAFQFLASYCLMRIIFHRDPPHRLSNCFKGAINKVKSFSTFLTRLTAVLKYPSAPNGTARFWKETKEGRDSHNNYLHVFGTCFFTNGSC